MSDIEEDEEVPIILGQPFLRVNKEKVMFNIYRSMRFLEDTSTCFQIEVIEQCVEEAFGENKAIAYLE